MIIQTGMRTDIPAFYSKWFLNRIREGYGIMNLLIEMPTREGVYQIVSGHRRKYCAEKLGYTQVPVIIRYMKGTIACHPFISRCI